MAFTDQCKLAAEKQIDHLVKKEGLTKTAAIEKIAKEADMSIRTVQRIVWPDESKYAKIGVNRKYPEITEALETITVEGKHRFEFGIGKWQKKDVLEIQEYNKDNKRTGNHFIIPLDLISDFVTIISSEQVGRVIDAMSKEAPAE